MDLDGSDICFKHGSDKLKTIVQRINYLKTESEIGNVKGVNNTNKKEKQSEKIDKKKKLQVI